MLMDNEGSPSKKKDTKPKRRLQPPGFESSFDVVPSPSKRRRAQNHIPNTEHTVKHLATVFDHTPRRPQAKSGQGRTPMRVSKPSQNFSEGSAVERSTANPSPFRSTHRVLTAFPDFVSIFGDPTTSTKQTSEPHVPRRCDVFTAQHTTESSDISNDPGNITAVTPRTPLRVLKPPSFKEMTGDQNQFLTKNLTSPHQSTSTLKAEDGIMSSSMTSHLLHFPHVPSPFAHPKEKTTESDRKLIPLPLPPLLSVQDPTIIGTEDNKSRRNSMTSRLPHLQDAISRLASPKGKATESDRKLVSLPLPALRPDIRPDSNETETVDTSKSHTQRAEILARSVRESRKTQSVSLELVELARGLELSPQKPTRDYGPKFIRGGLAERAENLLSRSNTNFSLWQSAFVKQLEGSKYPKEDIRLHVVSILSCTKHPGSPSISNGLPRNAITTCREVLQETREGDGSPPQQGTVVFLFSGNGKASSSVGLEVGKDVCVWRPWQEIDLPAAYDPLHQPLVEVKLPPSGSQRPGGQRTALLCSRFLVLS
ncbi:hypothetical protein K439DRAFT_1660756 [Ramaria rubella]|nr:hypothetical protein K439DRAFT_1660756 [Ramaria rubella]